MLLEETPAGVTLHFMDTGVDTGDIVHRRRLDIRPEDTAHSLYERLKGLELQLFQEAWPKLISGSYQRQRQNPVEGTSHKRGELLTGNIQHIDLNELVKAGDLIRRMRALTTDQIEEAAYYEVDGKRYRIQVAIQEDTDSA
jgi:methionyl-tRNA formyltransferase